jgi:hypothetical protein
MKLKKSPTLIKLKILRCGIEDEKCWYYNKVGKSLYFFAEFLFKDDGEDKDSLWRATIPTRKYVHIEDTNYNTEIRKLKLEKINESR